MLYFNEEMKKRGSDTIPATSWILKGTMKVEDQEAKGASQGSLDSMEVDGDEENGKANPFSERLILVMEEKLKGKKATRTEIEAIES